MVLYTPKSDRVNWVYIMTNRWNTTFYTGSTSDIVRRVAEHKAAEIDGFTKKYNLNRLVWFEIQDDMDTALLREARVKRWVTEWKVELIESMNPDWRDLYEDAKLSMAHASDY
jgi:putative endonuclease